ncbi:MAG: hypothetical protein GY875_06815 [Gammaproteobacteria bacterium]|nr:hypothetical protein [Gammaproteobacteria bacterium]
MHDRLTGVSATNAVIDDMEHLLNNNSNSHPAIPGSPAYFGDTTGKSAAQYAIDTVRNPNAHYFYNVTLKNFAAPWTNEAQTVFTPLNDYSATVIGAIRDDVDFREILSGDLVYVGRAGGISPYENDNNDHYEELEDLGPVAGDLSDPAILERDKQSLVSGLAEDATAGIMTSRAASMAFFSDGTNRAMFRFTLMNHLCTDLEPLKDVSRIPDHVRRDIPRSPGGDSRIFLNGCVGCHAGMDGMAGAFAYYEWTYPANNIPGGFLNFTDGAVSEKHNINASNFEHGYITDDDSWINYWRNGPNSILGNRPGDADSGWGHPAEVLDNKGNATGKGAKSLGIELANSKAFAQCQVDKVFKAVCLRDANVFEVDRDARDDFVTDFSGGGYKMREVFTDVAAHCRAG